MSRQGDRGRGGQLSFSLPTNVRANLLQLPGKVDRFLGISPPGQSRLFSPRDVVDLSQQLQSLLEYLQGVPEVSLPATVIELLNLNRGGAVDMALLRLVAAAARHPVDPDVGARRVPGLCPGHQETADIITNSCEIVQRILSVDQTTGSLPVFIRSMLAMQTLQACAQQLAAAANLPLARSGSRNRAWLAVRIALTLLEALSASASDIPARVRVAPTPELASALRESRVMEHLAQLLVRLVQLPNSDSQFRSTGARKFLVAYSIMTLDVLGRAESSPSELRDLAAAASGPCANFAAMALGLHMVSTADGGPTYGLPGELQERLPPLYDTSTVAERLAGAPGVVISPLTAFSLASAVYLEVASGRLIPAIGVTVLLRVGRLSVASCLQVSPARKLLGPRGAEILRSPQAAAAAAARGLPPLALPLVPMPPDGAAFLAPRVIGAVRSLLADASEGAWRVLADEWWLQLVCMCWAAGEPTGPDVRGDQLGQLIAEALLQDDAPVLVEDAPSPDVAAALSSGILPALERLIRVAVAPNSAPQDPAPDAITTLALHVLTTGSSATWQFLAPLLAYGEPRQAAALVASIAKVIRSGAAAPCASLVLGMVTEFLGAGFRELWGTASEAEGLPEPGACRERRFRVVAFTASEWLPVLAQRVLLWRPQLKSVLRTVVAWLLPLVAASAGAELACLTAGEREPGRIRRANQVEDPISCCAASATSRAGGGSGNITSGTVAPGSSAGAGSSPSNAPTRSTDGASSSAASSTSACGDLGGPDGPSTATTMQPRGGAVISAASNSNCGSSDGGGWLQVLMEGMDPVGLLGLALREWKASDPPYSLILAKACLVLTAAFPATVRSATTAAAVTGESSTPGGAPGGRTAVSTGAGGDGQAEAPGPGGLPWSPLFLLRLIVDLPGTAPDDITGGMEALCLLVQLWESGAWAATEEDNLLATVQEVGMVLIGHMGPFVGPLPSPAACRSLLGPVCGNRACTSLKADSEVGVALQLCGRCGGVGYCCRECQTAHWRAGHREACVQRKSGGGA